MIELATMSPVLTGRSDALPFCTTKTASCVCGLPGSGAPIGAINADNGTST